MINNQTKITNLKQITATIWVKEQLKAGYEWFLNTKLDF